MRKISFTEDKGSIFYKEFIQLVSQYFKENNLRRTGGRIMVIKIVLYFGLISGLYTIILNSNSLGAFYTFYLLTGIAVLLCAFNISHDASHNVAVKSKHWNKFLFQLSFNLQGNNAFVWGIHHTHSHHSYTNIEGSDIDVIKNPLVRMTDQQKHRIWHRFQHWYTPILYLFYSLNWFFMREFLMLFKKTSRTIEVKIPRIEIAKLILFKLIYIGYMIALPALILPFGVGPVILAFILNHFIISLIFTGVLAVSHLSDFVEHPLPDKNGLIPMSWPTLQLLSSVDYNPKSVILNWTLGGFNAHTLHHLLPHVSHVHYLKLLPILHQTADKHGLKYTSLNYRQALSAHFRFLRKMGLNETSK